jgi:hypothetical protein
LAIKLKRAALLDFPPLQPFRKNLASPKNYHIPLHPTFQMVKKFQVLSNSGNNLSSLWKREAGMDFWEGRFNSSNCYPILMIESRKWRGIFQEGLP